MKCQTYRIKAAAVAVLVAVLAAVLVAVLVAWVALRDSAYATCERFGI